RWHAKKKGPFRGPPRCRKQCFDRSEALGVAEVRGAAMRVVQVEVPRTAVVTDQLRVTITDIRGAHRDGGVPRSVPRNLHIVGGVTAHLAGGVFLAFDVVGVEDEGPVTHRPDVHQVRAGVRRTKLTGDLRHVAGRIDQVVLVDPRHCQAVLQAAHATQVEVRVGTEVDAVGLQGAFVAVTRSDRGDATVRTTLDAQARRDGTQLREVGAVDQGLRAERTDPVLDLDVVVVSAQVEPIGWGPDHAQRVLAGLLGAQVRVGYVVRVDLRGAGRRRTDRQAARRIPDRVGREAGLLRQDVQARGTEALAIRRAEGQRVDRLPARRDL